MPNAYLDKTKSQPLEPIIINPKTVDVYNDAALLPITSLSQADNIILDDGMIEKVPGTVKVSAGDLTEAAVMGLHRTYSPAGTKMALKLYNGTLYSTPSPSSTSKFETSVLANLATNKRTPWVDVRGKAYGVNETDGIIRYDANTAVGMKTGIVGPFARKKIAFFEDDETWTTTNGCSTTASACGAFRPEEWTGKSITSLRLDCSAASTRASASCTIPLDLSTFSDGKAVTDNDFISFYTYHTNRTNLSAVRVHFSTKGVDFSNSYTVYVDQELFSDGDFEWTKFNLRRGSFESVGTPDWSKVSAVRIVAESNTAGATVVHVDYMYLKPTPIVPKEQRRTLFNCEASTNETWTGSYQSFDYKQQHEGVRSVKMARAGGAAGASLSLATPVNLDTWADGVSISTSDELVFHVRANDISKITNTNPLLLKVGNNASNYLVRTFDTLADLGLTGNNQWFEIRVPKGRISAEGAGTVDWATIDYIDFTTSSLTSGGYLWIDDCYFEQTVQVTQIASFDDEAWTITGNGALVKDPHGKGWVTEGQWALKLWANKAGTFTESYGIYTPVSPLDLTAWDTGGASTTDDEITFSLYHDGAAKIDYAELWFDNNSLATFVDAYKYRITKNMFAFAGAKNHVGKEIRIKKSAFDEIKSAGTGSWSTIGAIKCLVYCKGSKTNAVTFDNIQLRRKVGITGRYYYKCIFKVGDVCSAASEESDHIDVKTSKVLLSQLPTSQDSRVTSREIYRKGGAYPDDWGLIKVIEDNTTTYITDDVDDDQITYFMGDEVPQGWINSVLCNNLVYDSYSDMMYYWGDPTHKNRVWFSHVGFYHVVDEWGYRDFPDDVQNVVPWFGQNIIFYRHRIQKIVDGDLTTGRLIDVPAETGACSYWAVGKPWKGMIPYVGWDNVYLFDGLRATAIGDAVKNYFKGRESFLSTVNIALVKDTLYIACKDKTGTPTYNDTVLRCYLPNKSWTVLPDWNVNVWCNFDKQDDNNDLYYGDSVTGDVYSINSTGWQFGSSNIAVDFDTGWLSFPDADIAIHSIEFKAKGTATSTLTFKGYKNLGSSASTQGTVTLTAAWQVFRLGPKGIMDLLRGNNIKLEFTQSGQNAWFKMKDIVIYAEKLSERVSITTANEVTCAAP